MKIYAVELCCTDIEGYFVCKVFSSREKAEKYLEKESKTNPLLDTEYFEIEEMEVE